MKERKSGWHSRLTTYKVPASVRGCFPGPEPWVFKNMFVNGITVWCTYLSIRFTYSDPPSWNSLRLHHNDQLLHAVCASSCCL